ncbi:hypothetical protein [Amycolatopsis sp. NPDC054798]
MSTVPVSGPRPASFLRRRRISGRAGELRALTDALSGGSDRHRPAIAAVTGPGGAGKTAVALHWLHQAQERYPDGQLYAGLSAHGPAGPATSWWRWQ